MIETADGANLVAEPIERAAKRQTRDLQSDGQGRYSTVCTLSEDIDAYMENRPVAATRPSAAYVASKFVRRHRLAVSIAAALLLVVTLAFAFVNSERHKAIAATAAGKLALLDAENSLRLADEARAAERAAAEDAEQRLTEFEWMADVKRLADRENEAETELWPAVPEKIDAMEAWIDAALRILDRIPVYREQLQRLRTEVTSVTIDGRSAWIFTRDEEKWVHDTLERLIARAEALSRPGTDYRPDGTLVSVRTRLELASSLEEETIVKHRNSWKEAIESIRNVEVCPAYAGLLLSPQRGLIPLGRDPDSGLWEFGLWGQTGSVPARDGAGRLILRDRSGFVFVLIPGGRSRWDRDRASPNAHRTKARGTRSRLLRSSSPNSK